MILASSILAHEPTDRPSAEEVEFSCPVAEVSGTLLTPGERVKVPCVVMLGGTMSHTRDGQLSRAGVPYRDALKRLKREQAAATPFLLKDLPIDHPARLFARQVNPE